MALMDTLRNVVNNTAIRTILATGTAYTADAVLNTTEISAQTAPNSMAALEKLRGDISHNMTDNQFNPIWNNFKANNAALAQALEDQHSVNGGNKSLCYYIDRINNQRKAEAVATAAATATVTTSTAQYNTAQNNGVDPHQALDDFLVKLDGPTNLAQFNTYLADLRKESIQAYNALYAAFKKDTPKGDDRTPDAFHKFAEKLNDDATLATDVHNAIGAGQSQSGPATPAAEPERETSNHPAYGALLLAHKNKVEAQAILDGKGPKAPKSIKLSVAMVAAGYSIVSDKTGDLELKKTSRTTGRVADIVLQQELQKFRSAISSYNGQMSDARTSKKAADKKIVKAQENPYIQLHPELDQEARQQAVKEIEVLYKEDLNGDKKIGAVERLDKSGPETGLASVGGGTYYASPDEIKNNSEKSEKLNALAALGVTDKPDEVPLGERTNKQLQTLLDNTLEQKMKEGGGRIGVGSLANTDSSTQKIIDQALQGGVDKSLISQGVENATGTHVGKVKQGRSSNNNITQLG